MFRIQQTTEQFLTKLGEPGKFIKTRQEFGYLCFLYGFAKNVSVDPEDAVGDKETSDVYVEQIRPLKHLIAGMIGLSRLHRANLNLEDENILMREFMSLLDSDSSLRINGEGVKEINRITYAGYEKLKEDLGQFPDTPAFFIKRYVSLIRSAFEEHWS